MPYKIQESEGRYCVHKENEDGSAGERLKCYDNRKEAEDYMKALYANVEDASKSEYPFSPVAAIKAVGDYRLHVLGIPFHSFDSDRQYFDEATKLMQDKYPLPLIAEYHGIGQADPNIPGDAIKTWKENDGIWVEVELDPIKGKDAWDAALAGKLAASSGSILHLDRLEIGGKLVQWDKRIPGRVAVWPFVELSLINQMKGQRPANKNAIAFPAMKSIYEQAGLDLPEITGEFENDEQESRKAAKIARKNLQKRVRAYLLSIED